MSCSGVDTLCQLPLPFRGPILCYVISIVVIIVDRVAFHVFHDSLKLLGCSRFAFLQRLLDDRGSQSRSDIFGTQFL